MRTILHSIGSGITFIYNDDGLIVGYQMVYVDGDDMFASDPIQFDWPIQHLPVPRALAKEIN